MTPPAPLACAAWCWPDRPPLARDRDNLIWKCLCVLGRADAAPGPPPPHPKMGHPQIRALGCSARPLLNPPQVVPQTGHGHSAPSGRLGCGAGGGDEGLMWVLGESCTLVPAAPGWGLCSAPAPCIRGSAPSLPHRWGAQHCPSPTTGLQHRSRPRERSSAPLQPHRWGLCTTLTPRMGSSPAP